MNELKPTVAELCEQLVQEHDPMRIVELVEQINRVEYSRVCERCSEEIAVNFCSACGTAVCAQCEPIEAKIHERT
jgi:hypothetical protein